jgi:hypothetical protein
VISTTSQLAAIIKAGGAQIRYVADVIVDGTRVLKDQPIGFSLTQDGTARVRSQATATLVYSDQLGQSIAPSTLTSWMTPYATFLNVSVIYQVGAFIERIVVGYFKVTDVDDPTETKVNLAVLGRVITVGSSVSLTLADAFHITDLEKFQTTTSPTSTGVWDEIASLTGLPVVRNITDATIPSTVAYSQNRLDAVIALAAVLGGIPYVDNLNRVQIQPNAWPSQSGSLTIGAGGSVIDVSPDALTDQGICNIVVGSGVAADQTPIFVTATLTSGPLRYGGPFGRVPYFATLPPSVVDTASAQAFVNSLLPQVSTVPAGMFEVTCVPDPRREVGDVVSFQRMDATLVGRIVKKTLSDKGPMVLSMAVNSA